jgi:hypothetical protein
MTHQSDEDARQWAATLADPLPGSPDVLDGNEIDQLKNL